MADLEKTGRAEVTNGSAEIRLAPERANEDWTVTRMTVQNTGSTLVPECRVYEGQVSPSKLIDGTSTGTFDINDVVTPIKIRAGSCIIAVWTGADNGSSCIFTIKGESNR